MEVPITVVTALSHAPSMSPAETRRVYSDPSPSWALITSRLIVIARRATAGLTFSALEVYRS